MVRVGKTICHIDNCANKVCREARVCQQAMTPEPEKRLAEIRKSLDRNPDIDDWSCDVVRFLLSIIDDLLAENAKLNSINSMLKHSNNLLKDALE